MKKFSIENRNSQFKNGLTSKIHYAGFLEGLMKIHTHEIQGDQSLKWYNIDVVPCEDVVVGSLIFSELALYPEYIIFIDSCVGSVKCQAKSLSKIPSIINKIPPNKFCILHLFSNFVAQHSILTFICQ